MRALSSGEEASCHPIERHAFIPSGASVRHRPQSPSSPVRKNVTKIKLTALAFVGCALGAALFSGRSFAGYKVADSTVHVNVLKSMSLASGSLAAARNSSDGKEYIGCELMGQNGTPSVDCAASDSTGVTVSCFSAASWAVTVVSGMNSDAAINFSWDASGNCTSINSWNESYYSPK
jgi:hypothetical protein